MSGMKQHHIDNLTDDEIGVLFYIVNIALPITCPKIEFDFNSIKWYKHDMLAKKLLEAFN